MNVIFEDKDLEELLQTGKNKKYKNIARDKKLVDKLQRVLSLFEEIDNINKLSLLSFLHYEKLKHSYSGFSSVRPFGSSRVERLIFFEENDKITIKIIELDNTHYGNKK